MRNEKYKEAMAANFDYCVLPMSWKQLQPQENVFATEALDEWVDVLGRKRIPTIAGPLIRLDEASVPDWMVIWEHDFDMLREMAYDFVQKVVNAISQIGGGVERRRRHGNQHRLQSDVRADHRADPAAGLAGENADSQRPHDDHHHASVRRISRPAPRRACRRCSMPRWSRRRESALRRLRWKSRWAFREPGNFTRDLFQLSSMLDRFSTLGRPVFLTAVGVPGGRSPDVAGGSEPSRGGPMAPTVGPAASGRLDGRGLHMAFSKPFVESIAWANLGRRSAIAARRRTFRRHAAAQAGVAKASANSGKVSPAAEKMRVAPDAPSAPCR